MQSFRAKFQDLVAHISFSRFPVRRRFLLHTTTYAFRSLSEVGGSLSTLGTSKIQDLVEGRLCAKFQGPIQSFSCPHFIFKVPGKATLFTTYHYIRFLVSE